MSFRYGRCCCDHNWRRRKDGYEEQCLAIICIKCGAFACACEAESTVKLLKDREYSPIENIGGNWSNPDIDRLPKTIRTFQKKINKR